MDRFISKFYQDMGPKPSEDYSLDRIDNDGDYSPDNCKWSTRAEQYRNRRTNRMISFNNQTLTITEWSKILNINTNTLMKRFNKGWSIEKAITTPTNMKMSTKCKVQ